VSLAVQGFICCSPFQIPISSLFPHLTQNYFHFLQRPRLSVTIASAEIPSSFDCVFIPTDISNLDVKILEVKRGIFQAEAMGLCPDKPIGN
jgi:hypothetical protein